MIKLYNGAEIYTFGKPHLFIMSGVHGEERSGPLALRKLIHYNKNLENVWVLPCLNLEGFNTNNRYCGTYNLNSEWKDATQVDFVKQLMALLEMNKPKLFVDLHEDYEQVDYVWSNHNNPVNIENEVRDFCIKRKVGWIVWPRDKVYEGTSEDWAAQKGIPAYTPEVGMYQNFDKRMVMANKFIEFFVDLSKRSFAIL